VAGKTLATAFVAIRPDGSRFPGELRRQVESKSGTAGKQVGTTFGKGMLAGVGAVLTAGVVIDFFKGTIAEAQEAAKVGRLTQAVIKSTGQVANVSAGQVSDLAESLSELSGVDDEVIQSGANVLLTFTKIRNEAGKGNDIFNQGTAAALDLSAALGTDLQASILLVGKALNDPISGLTALKKAGIQLTEQQKEQIKAFVEAGDIMSAQKIILAELTTQFGGAAAAAASPADKARVAWGNFQEEVGNKLLPTLNELLTFATDNKDWLLALVG
jgi:phage-related minor tail protein